MVKNEDVPRFAAIKVMVTSSNLGTAGEEHDSAPFTMSDVRFSFRSPGKPKVR